MSGKGGWFSNLFGSGPDPKPTTKPASASEPALPATSANELPPAETPAAPPEPPFEAASYAQTEWKEGLSLHDDFKIEKVLGIGGQGRVYSALSLTEGRRYAVKRIKFKDAESQRRIMGELQSWIYLPEHPHLAACRFSRTWGNEIDIFIERVNGSKLDDWVREGKLYDGGAKKALERIIDFSIQYAWGLDALHEMNVIHGDARPCNIFIGESNVAKISDIGLTRALAHGSVVGKVATPTIVVQKVVKKDATGANAVLPPAPLDYRSPEQIQGKELSVASDTWSWGVSVLEMFIGSQSWPAEPLEQFVDTYLKTGPQDKKFPAMPPEIADLLKQCFHVDPTQRLQFLSQPAEVLQKLFRTVVGKPYPRALPAILHRGSMLSIAHARWSPGGGVQWAEPIEWEVKAKRAAGNKELKRPKLVGSRFSKKVQGQTDLPSYARTQSLYENLLAGGHKELEYEYALLCYDKAFVHAGIEDIHNAIVCFDKAIQLFEELVNKEDRKELANDLAMCYLNRAIALKHQDKFTDALPIYEQAFSTWDRLVNKENRRELAGNLAWVLALRAEVMFILANHTRGHSEQLTKQLHLKKESAIKLSSKLPPSLPTLPKPMPPTHQPKLVVTPTLKASPLPSTPALATPTTITPTTAAPPATAPKSATASSPITPAISAVPAVPTGTPVAPEPTVAPAAVIDPEEVKRQEEAIALKIQVDTLAHEITSITQSVASESKTAQDLLNKAQLSARESIKLLKSEVLRTNREDLRAILHWADKLFDGLL